jgi:phosphoribosylglycinamide formyltransferase-1
MKPNIIIPATGTKDGGGSGFENLVLASRSGILGANIAAVVSNISGGGVEERAKRLGITFVYLPIQSAALYRGLAGTVGVKDPWFACSGWLRKIEGLDPARTFNIHPALLSFDRGRFGGKGMYGHHVHEAVAAALERGELMESGFTMHFVDAEYDRGPAFAEVRVPLRPGMTADQIAKRVNEAEHKWQPFITNEVVHERIRLVDGKVQYDADYQFLPAR